MAEGGGLVATKAKALDDTGKRNVKVTVKGKQYTVGIDGRTVVTYTDTTERLSPTGRFGFALDNAELHIDDLKITSP